MYDYNQILTIARTHLNELEKNIGEKLDFSMIEEESFGYVFCYQSVEFLKTKSFSARLVGNSPFIVNATNGEVVTLGTAKPLNDYVEDYRNRVIHE